jgi:ATP synthase protein I
MVRIASSPKPGSPDNSTETAEDGFEAEFQPLTAEQVQAWKQQNPAISPWRVLAFQVVVGALVAALIGWFSEQFRLAASAAWGSVAVVIPAAVFARALSRQMRRSQSGAALVGLFVWELVKIILTVALLLVAPKVVSDLSWLALLAGFVVTMKVYWLAMALSWMQPKSKPNIF